MIPRRRRRLTAAAVTDPFANEPSPNGGYIDMGAFGNTAQASRSPTTLMLIMDPNGGEVVGQNSTFPVRWRASGFAGSVLLEYSSTGAAGPFEGLAASEPNDGTYDWSVTAALPTSSDYVLRISSLDQPEIADLSDGTFQVSLPNSTYYVNIAGDVNFADNEFTTAAGSDVNTGLSPASPLASIQAVLNTFDLGPGDVIYVDTGSYSITTNILIGAADSGVRIQGPVDGTHLASLNRNSTATASYVFQLQNATQITLDSLVIFGANEGVLVNLASHDFTISNAIVRDNSVFGIHVEDTAQRALIANSEVYNNPNAGIYIEGDDAIVRNNTLRDNRTGSGRGVEVTSTAANAHIMANDVFRNTVGIFANQPSATSSLRIEENAVHEHGNTGITVFGSGLVINNQVYANTGGTGIQVNGTLTEARDNAVYGNRIGIRPGSGAIARYNRVYANTENGFYMEQGSALENIVYSNAIGINIVSGSNVIGNNLIYANSAFGIEQQDNVSTIFNNTFYQPSGDAIHYRFAFSASGTISANNNIFWVTTGSAFNISTQHQVGFSSDYNLFKLTGTGKAGTWGTTAYSNWTDWQFATGNDRHGLSADPLFVDPDGIDNTLGNLDDDFHFNVGSPAQDAGSPLALYAGEPAGGNRVDLGAYGNTAESLPTTSPRIQLVEPNTYQKVELGQPVDVRWITSGLTNPAPVALIDAGGTGAYDVTNGRWSGDVYRSGSTQTGSITQAINVSAVTNLPPLSVLQKFVNEGTTGVGAKMRYDIPLADGSYQIRLFFVDPTASAANQRKFDVTLQSQTVLVNYDIFADAGAVRKAVAKTFTFTAAHGNGLNLEFVNRTSVAVVNAFEITRIDTSAPASFAVNLEFSPDNGQSWSTIATNLTSNRFGEGRYFWNATESTQGHTGLFRATAVASGLANVIHTTTRGISVANATNSFYVNTVADANFADNEYTTAAGDDLNSGTSPSSPLASLATLLKNYTLSAGDTVYVDSGTYNLPANLELTASHSGVRIQGPQVGSHAAVLNRGNTSTGNFAVHLKDATDVTLDSLELVGGFYGLRVDLASHDATLSNSVVRNNVGGVYVLSTANRAVISQNDIFANTSNGIDVEGDNVLIEQNLIHNNMGGISVVSAAEGSVLRGNDIYGHSGFAISVTGNATSPPALIEQNTVHANPVTSFQTAALIVSNTPAIVQDNAVFGNGKSGISMNSTAVIAQRNVIYNNTDGITGVGIVRDNRIFHNTQAGVRLTSAGGVVTGNSIYANASGIVLAGPSSVLTTIANNVIYDDTTVGIDLSVTGTPSLVSVRNNTILEPTAAAIRVNTGTVDVRNNILSVGSGTIFSIANAAQAGFTSDYNTFQVTGSGKVGGWGTANLFNRTDWYFELGRDEHSIEADPQFIDIDGPDGRRGWDLTTSTDFGADDNFREQPGSPAVDAGDPLSYYSLEPFSGNRVNVGAFGNTAEAASSLALRMQLTEPAGLRKFEVGQPITLPWISSGFTSQTPVALLNAGGTGIFDPAHGRWGADAYRTGGTSRTVTGTVDLSGVNNPPPAALFQTYTDLNSGDTNGQSMRYDLPLPDGTYNVRLFFVEPSGGNTRRFDVKLQGQTVLDDYQILVDAGAVRKAVAKSFTITASQGTGLNLQLINANTAAGFEAVISGIEVTRTNAIVPTTFATNLEFSPDNGQTWSTIASNFPAGRFGDGSFTWNATQQTQGNSGVFRITAVGDGLPSVQYVSAPVSISSDGNSYYVNIPTDGNVLDNEYTTASGDNLNTGKSPDSPMRSLAALIRAYDLDAGDTVFVDSGSYQLFANIVLGAEDSGVTVQGPIVTGHSAVLNRGNNSAGNYGFELVGGIANVAIDSLEIHNAEDAIHITTATNIEVRNSILRNNLNRGVYVETTANNIRVLNNQLQENTSRGVEIRGTQVAVEGNLIRNSDKGVHVNSPTAANVTVRDNDLFGHNAGVELTINGTGILIQGNSIHDNATHGINGALVGSSAGLQIIGNEIYGQSGAGDFGITLNGSSGANEIVSDNSVHHNFTGINATGTGTIWQRNRVYSNTNVGINIPSGSPDVRDNHVYSNAIGIVVRDSSQSPSIRNNLVYSNANSGIDVQIGTSLIVGNTIVHPVGTAVRYTGTGTGTFKNNIVQGDVGTLVSVATGGQAGFVSNYNLLYPTTGLANVGSWGSQAAASLADWQALTTRDMNSVSADPLFLDMDGADNVLGEKGVPEGNGFDDNFGPRTNSAAIDAADGSVALTTDALGRLRVDDPGRLNTGTGAIPYTDIGAYEFQGSSLDITPPTVIASALHTHESAGVLSHEIHVIFSEPIDLIDALATANYEFREAGDDQLFGNSDDIVYLLTPHYTSGSTELILEIDASKPLPPLGNYYLRLSGDTSIHDLAGVKLDGNHDGQPGGDFVGINSPPAIVAIDDQTIAEGQLLTIVTTASDANALTFSLKTGAPEGVSIESATGVITWTASETQGPGSYPITVIVSDNGSPTMSNSQSFLITVEEANNAPTIAAISNQSVDEGSMFSLLVPATDTDQPANSLTFSLAVGAPELATIDPTTGLVTWTPTETDGPGSYDITVVATDNGEPNRSATSTFQVVVREVNVAPVLDVLPNRLIVQRQTLTGNATASDTDIPTNSLTFRLDPGAPAGMTIHPQTGVFAWTPSSSDSPGNYPITVRVSDDGAPSLSRARSFTVTVLAATNHPPVMDPIGNQTIVEQQSLQFTITASDPNDVPAHNLAFQVAGLPSGASFNSSSGAFSWIPNESQQGLHSITFTVTDDGSPTMSDVETISIDVGEINEPPVLDLIGDKSILEGNALTFTASAQDVDEPANSFTYTLDASVPSGASIDASTGAFSWTPTEAQGPGSFTVTVLVTDNGIPALSDFETFTITVGEVNQSPVLGAIGSQSANEGSTLNFSAAATDSDFPAQSLVYSLDSGAPFGASIHASTGLFTWTPTEAQGPGTFAVTVRVTDNGIPALDDFETFTITVGEVNQSPVLGAIGNKSVDEQQLLAFSVTASDANDVPANSLSLSASGLPSGASFNSATGNFAWTPNESQQGTFLVTFTVSDAGIPSLSDSEQITITVNEVNDAPILTPIGDKSVNEQLLLAFTVTASDANDVPANLSLSVSGLPIGADFNSETGAFAWTPNESQQGSYVVIFTVSDAGTPSYSDSEQITITVNEVNDAPILTPIGNKSVDEQQLLAFSVTASDVNDDPANNFSLSVSGMPSGASFNSATGAFAWTPDESQQGTFLVTFTVTDAGTPALSDSELITITVNEVNQPPVLNAIGNWSINAGELLSLTAVASDADLPANALLFSLDSGAPAGTAIDAVTGNFTWTPTTAQAGTNLITIRVTDDGSPAKSATQTFTVSVNGTNTPPVMDAVNDRSINEKHKLSIKIAATDADKHSVLVFSLDAGSPAGASIDSKNGKFTWTPTEEQGPGSYSIVARVTDNGTPAMSDARTFTVTVNDVNEPPVLDAIPAKSVDEGSRLAFVVLATDNDWPRNVLTFTLVAGAPAGAQIDPVTGLLTWTPTEEQGPGKYGITVRVTDNGAPSKSDSERFSVTVREINEPPVKKGSPNAASIAQSNSSVFTQTLQLEIIENPTPWQNRRLPWDTDGDHVVVPLDALRIMNQLNDPIFLQGDGRLPGSRPADSLLPMYDVNGDGFATTNDVVRIINYLNKKNLPGEGEARSADELDLAHSTPRFHNSLDAALHFPLSAAAAPYQPKKRPTVAQEKAFPAPAIIGPIQPSTIPSANEVSEEFADILDEIASDVTDAWRARAAEICDRPDVSLAAHR